MHNFKRALKIALAHRVNVVACIFTSAIIAVLWGGNLTAVFPVVEVIMNDHALPDWIDQKIEEAQQRGERLATLARSARKAEGRRCRRNSATTSAQKSIAARPSCEAHRKKSGRRLGRRPNRRKNPARQTTSSIWKRWPTRRPTKSPAKFSAGDRRHQTARSKFTALAHRSLQLDRARRASLVAHDALRHTAGRLPVRGRVHAREGRVSNLEQHCRLAPRQSHSATTCAWISTARCCGWIWPISPKSGRGDLMNRCTTDLNSITQGVQRLFGQALLEPLKDLVCFGIAAWISWRLLAADDHHRARCRLLDPLARQSAQAHSQEGDARAFDRSMKRSPKPWAASSSSKRSPWSRPNATSSTKPRSCTTSAKCGSPCTTPSSSPVIETLGHRDGARGCRDGRLPRPRPAHAHPRHQDQRYRPSRTAT